MNGQPIVFSPRVTPDPDAAAALEARLQALRYHPENGFHRDSMQQRIPVLPGLLRRQAD